MMITMSDPNAGLLGPKQLRNPGTAGIIPLAMHGLLTESHLMLGAALTASSLDSLLTAISTPLLRSAVSTTCCSTSSA